MKTQWTITSLLLCGLISLWTVSGPAQSIPPIEGPVQVLIESRSGNDALVISGDVFPVEPDARIRDWDGYPARLDQIRIPAEATVEFAVNEQGKISIQSIKLEEFTK